MDLPFSLPAPLSAYPVHRHVRRLGWALLASLLIHFTLVGDFAGIQPWHPGSLSKPPPLQVEFAVAASEGVPAAIQRSSPPARVPPRLDAEPAFQHLLLPPAKVMSLDAMGGRQAEEPEHVIDSPLNEIPADQTSDGVLQRLPPSGKLVYQFYWGRSRWLAGLATHQWLVENGNYTLSSTVTTTGLFGLIHPVRLIETSQGSVSGDKLRPQMFITQLDEHPPAIAYFNWNKGYFRWYRGTASFTQSLPASAYDKISFLYQLYLTPLKEDFLSTAITMGRRLEHYEIRNLGIEEIEIGGQAYPATHLKRITASADIEQVEIWLSTRDKLPIKMVYANSAGDRFEQLIAAESIPGNANQ